jgi:hypothetical protein
MFGRSRGAARLVMTLCLLSALVPWQSASAEDRAIPQLVKQSDTKIAPALSTFPTIFPVDETSSTLVCVTNINANSEAQLEPEDTFLATLDESGLENFSSLSPLFLVDSSTLEAADFVGLIDTENRRLVIRYVGAPASFQPGESFCAQVSLNTKGITGSRALRFGFPSLGSRFSTIKQSQYVTFAVHPQPTASVGPEGAAGQDGAVGPMGPAGTAGADGLNGANGADGAIGPVGPAGADGAIGPAGPAGVTGAVGPIGPAGAAGVDGAVGPIGPAGAAGTDGAVGPTGPAGAAGADGINGTNGVDGAIGPIGPAGADGAVGPMGPVGVAGTDGAVGPMGPAGA